MRGSAALVWRTQRASKVHCFPHIFDLTGPLSPPLPRFVPRPPSVLRVSTRSDCSGTRRSA